MLTDPEARAIARRLARAARQPPTEATDRLLAPPPSGADPADETQIVRALVALGVVPPDFLDDPSGPPGSP